MKRFCLTLLAIAFLTVTQARVYTPASVPLVHLQDRNRYVSNPDNILSQEAVSRIDAIFRAVEDSTGIQTLVAVLSEIEPDDCFEFAIKLGEESGVGKSENDNGLVILLCTGERCIQFVTGYGIEGILPDAICKRIQTNHMNSHFSNGRWDEGMVAGAEVLKETLMSGEYRGPVGENKSEKLGAVILIVGFGLFLLVMTLAIVSGRKSRKCPRCGKITLKQISATTISKKNGVKEELVTLKCTNCHHIVERTRKSYYSTGSNTRGPHIGGGFGGGFSGGRGFSGGSYGGGRFGGGGAGSRF